MKILFDANTPAPLARFLRGHDVVRADELGWQGIENSALLDAAEQAGFDLLLTCDQNLRYRSRTLRVARWHLSSCPRIIDQPCFELRHESLQQSTSFKLARSLGSMS